MNLIDSVFQNNTVTHEVITNDDNLVIKGSKFVNNTTDAGVITTYNAGTTTIYDSTFSGNSSRMSGAIDNTTGATLNLIAQNQNVIFENNTANGVANDILNNGTINLNTALGMKISLDGGINAAEEDVTKNTININKTSSGTATDPG